MKKLLLVLLLISAAPVFAMENTALMVPAESARIRAEREKLLNYYMDCIVAARQRLSSSKCFEYINALIRAVTIDEFRRIVMGPRLLDQDINHNLEQFCRSPRYITILDIAIETGRNDLAKFLKRDGAQTGQERMEMQQNEFVERMTNAINTSNHHEFRRIDEDYRSIFDTPDYQPILQKFIDRGFDVNMNLRAHFNDEALGPISILLIAAAMQEADTVEFLIERGARTDIQMPLLCSACAPRMTGQAPLADRCRTIATLLDEGAPVSSLLTFRGEYQSIADAQTLAFLLMYLDHLGKREDFYALRNNQGQTLQQDMIEQVDWRRRNNMTTKEEEKMIHLLSNPHEAATLYPKLKEEFEKCQEFRKHRVYRRAGSKGIQI